MEIQTIELRSLDIIHRSNWTLIEDKQQRTITLNLLQLNLSHNYFTQHNKIFSPKIKKKETNNTRRNSGPSSGCSYFFSNSFLFFAHWKYFLLDFSLDISCHASVELISAACYTLLGWLCCCSLTSIMLRVLQL